MPLTNLEFFEAVKGRLITIEESDGSISKYYYIPKHIYSNNSLMIVDIYYISTGNLCAYGRIMGITRGFEKDLGGSRWAYAERYIAKHLATKEIKEWLNET